MNQSIAALFYVACSVCGFDHSYEPEEADRKHKDLAASKERKAFDSAQKLLDGMSDEQVVSTWNALEKVFHTAEPGENFNGLNLQQWSDLVCSEWDRRGGTWKKWAGNK